MDLYNYTTIAGLERTTGVDTPKLTTRADLICLKAQVVKLHKGTLKADPADFSKLSIVDNSFVKKLCLINW